MQIKEIMKPVHRVPYSMNIAGVAVTMTLNKTHCLIVDHFDGSLGFITEKDIIREVVSRCKDAATVRAWEIMSQPLISADADTEIHDAIEIMRRQKVRSLVVTNGDKILGIVKRSTILNSLRFEEFEYWTADKAVIQEKDFVIH